VLLRVGQGHEVKEGWQQRVIEFTNEDDHKKVDELKIITTDLEELIHATYQDQGVRWRLNCLNKSLGSLRKGDFGFIFARPETGKTTFLASETTSFISSPDERVVWFN